MSRKNNTCPIIRQVLFYLFTVFSGLAAQWTVGTLSDRFDRTVVLSVVATAIAAVSGFMFINAETSFWGMAVEMGLFGALAFALLNKMDCEGSACVANEALPIQILSHELLNFQ